LSTWNNSFSRAVLSLAMHRRIFLPRKEQKNAYSFQTRSRCPSRCHPGYQKWNVSSLWKAAMKYNKKICHSLLFVQNLVVKHRLNILKVLRVRCSSQWYPIRWTNKNGEKWWQRKSTTDFIRCSHLQQFFADNWKLELAFRCRLLMAKRLSLSTTRVCQFWKVQSLLELGRSKASWSRILSSSSNLDCTPLQTPRSNFSETKQTT